MFELKFFRDVANINNLIPLFYDLDWRLEMKKF